MAANEDFLVGLIQESSPVPLTPEQARTIGHWLAIHSVVAVGSLQPEDIVALLDGVKTGSATQKDTGVRAFLKSIAER